MVNIKGFDIPHTLEELTIEQFDHINSLEKDEELDKIERWVRKFVYLGVPEEVVNSMNFTEFKDAIAKFNDVNPHAEKMTSVEVGGYTYECSSIGVKELSLIEKAWKRSTNNFGATCVSIIFKRTDLTSKEHYDNAHIAQKVKLFKTLTANYAAPYILEVVEELTATAKDLVDEAEK